MVTRVTVESLTRMQVVVRTDRHALVGDEPEGVGDGLGPSPYDLLLASLGM